ncbi:MAG: ABC transporter substrate-binding protein [Betaproteobacteria bacterium]|nr:ABC transporter substrate-binding protein [Betaproteobacteria bacterium]
MTTRRELLVALGAALASLPAYSQQPVKVWRIGIMSPRERPASLDTGVTGAWIQSLRDLGYVEGKNLAIEWRFGNGNNERLAELAAELVRMKVDVIVAQGVAARAAQQATATLPIVFTGVGDPVGVGLVASLAKPGKNSTGVTNLSGDTAAKNLEIIRTMVPKLSRAALLLNPNSPLAPIVSKNIQSAGKLIGIGVSVFEAGNPGQIDAAFATVARAQIGALIVAPDGYFSGLAPQIAALAAKLRLPTIYENNAYMEVGGLMSYGENYVSTTRRAAVLVDKVLKGAKPADLPVEQATRLELVINRKTATALGLTIPQSLLISAERVIE